MLPKSLENLSHATIITGNRVENFGLVKTFLSDQGIDVQGNSDVFILDQESLGIDVIRDEVIRFVSSQKVSNARVVILSFDRATTESQNALLKSIEEPQVGTYFFILVPNTDLLLPTVLSRAQIISGNYSAGETRLNVHNFLKANLSARFALVEDFTKNKKDEDNLSKSEVISFLDTLEKFLWEQGNRDEQLFTDIRKMREYANIRGASHRVILDYVAMIAPIVK